MGKNSSAVCNPTFTRTQGLGVYLVRTVLFFGRSEVQVQEHHSCCWYSATKPWAQGCDKAGADSRGAGADSQGPCLRSGAEQERRRLPRLLWPSPLDGNVWMRCLACPWRCWA